MNSEATAMDSDADDDILLLRRFVTEQDETAFARLVQQRVGLVYSVAMRHVGGDAHRAEDAAQAVFLDLARKASVLASRPTLVGWLYRSARFAAAGIVRTERRRMMRELKANLMKDSDDNTDATVDWDRVRPMLDEVLSEMEERDRDAILLRYFDGRGFTEIGDRMGLSENAARMRVERALDKLHAALAKRGVTSTAVALGVAVGASAGIAAPAALGPAIAATALQAAAVSAGQAILGILAMSKIQVGVAAAVAIAVSGSYFAVAREEARLRKELAAYESQPTSITALREENRRLTAAAREAEALRGTPVMRKELEEKIALRRREKARTQAARAPRSAFDEREANAKIDRMNREGNALVNEYKELVRRSKDASLAADERSAAGTNAQLKMGEIQAKQREISDYIESLPKTSGGEPPERRQFYISPGTPTLTFDPLANPTAAAVALSLPGTTAQAALSVYQSLVGKPVEHDASLVSVDGVFDFASEPMSRSDLAAALARELQQRLGVRIEAMPDGRLVARKSAAGSAGGESP